MIERITINPNDETQFSRTSKYSEIVEQVYELEDTSSAVKVPIPHNLDIKQFRNRLNSALNRYVFSPPITGAKLTVRLLEDKQHFVIYWKK